MRLTIPREIVDCIAQAREPSAEDIHKVADHILSDIVGTAHWLNHRPLDRPRLLSFRAARAALTGCR